MSDKGGDSSDSAASQTPQQWAAALSNSSIAAWKEADILALSLAQLQALSVAQIPYISVPWALPAAAWTADTLNAVPLQYWPKFGPRYLLDKSSGSSVVTQLSQLSGVTTGNASGRSNWFDDLGYSYQSSSGQYRFAPSVVSGINASRIAEIGRGLGNALQAPNLVVNNGVVDTNAFESAITVATNSGEKVSSWTVSSTKTAYMFASGWADMGSSFMSALTAVQLGAIVNPETKLGAVQLGYLSANQLIALNMDWSKLTAAQLNGMAVDAFSGVQTNNIAAISASAWSGVDRVHMVTLTAADIQLLSPTKIAALQYLGYALTASVGAVLTAAQVQSIPSACWAQISDAGFLNALSIAAFQAIPPSAFSRISRTLLSGVDSLHLSNLTDTQLQSFPVSVVTNAAELAALFYVNPSTLNFSDFVNNPHVNWTLAPASFIRQLSLAQVRLLQPVQVAQLSVLSIAGLTRSQTQALSLAQIQAMSAAQLGAAVYISRRIDVVAQIFVPSLIIQMPKSFWQRVDSSFLNTLTIDAFLAITTPQITLIGADAFAGLDQAHFNAFTGTQLLALSAEQVGAFAGEYLTIGFLRGVRLGAFKGLVPGQMRRLHDYLFNTVATNAFATSNPALLESAENQFATLLASIMDSDDGREVWLEQSVSLLIRLQWLDPTAASALSASDVENVYSSLNWAWMSGEFLNNIMTSVFADIRANSVAQFNLKAIAALDHLHLQALTVAQAAALSGDQLSAISDLGSLQASVVQSLSAAQIAGITQDWSTISSNFLNHMTSTQFAAMTATQFGQLTYLQLTNPNNQINWSLLSADDWNELDINSFSLLCQGSNPAILQASTEALLQLKGPQLVALANASKRYNPDQVRSLLNSMFGYFSAEQSQQVLNLVLNDSVDQIVLKVALINTLADIDGTSLGIDMAIQTLATMQQTQPSWLDGGSLALLVPVLRQQFYTVSKELDTNAAFTTYFNRLFATASFLPAFVSYHKGVAQGNLNSILAFQSVYKAGFESLQFAPVIDNQVSRVLSTSSFLEGALPNILNNFRQQLAAGALGNFTPSEREALLKNFDAVSKKVIADVTNEMAPGGGRVPLITVEESVAQQNTSNLTRYLKTRFSSSVDTWLQENISATKTQKGVIVAATQAARTALAFGGLLASLPGLINEIGRASYINDKLPTKEKNALLASSTLGAIAYVAQALVIPGSMVIEALIQKYTGVKYQDVSYSRAIWQKFTEGFVALYKNQHDQQIVTRATNRALTVDNATLDLRFVTTQQNAVNPVREYVLDAELNPVLDPLTNEPITRPGRVITVNVVDALAPDPVFVKITPEGAATVLASNRQGIQQTSVATFDQNGVLIEIKDAASNTITVDAATRQRLEALAAQANTDEARALRSQTDLTTGRVTPGNKLTTMLLVQQDGPTESVRLNKVLGMVAQDVNPQNAPLYHDLIANNVERFVYRAWQLGLIDSQATGAGDTLTTAVRNAQDFVQNKGVTLTADVNTKIVSAVTHIRSSTYPDYQLRDYYLTKLQYGKLSALTSAPELKNTLQTDGNVIGTLSDFTTLRDQVATDYALQLISEKLSSGGYDGLITQVRGTIGTQQAGAIGKNLTEAITADLAHYGVQFAQLDATGDYALDFQIGLKLRILNQLAPPNGIDPNTGLVLPDADTKFYATARSLGVENQPVVLERLGQYALGSLQRSAHDGVPRSANPVQRLVEYGEEIFSELSHPDDYQRIFGRLGASYEDPALGKALADIVAKNAFGGYVADDVRILPADIKALPTNGPDPGLNEANRIEIYQTAFKNALEIMRQSGAGLNVPATTADGLTTAFRSQLADLVAQNNVFAMSPRALNKVPVVYDSVIYQALARQLKLIQPEVFGEVDVATIINVVKSDGPYTQDLALAIPALRDVMEDQIIAPRNSNSLRIPSAPADAADPALALRGLVAGPAGTAVRGEYYLPVVAGTMKTLLEGGLREAVVTDAQSRQRFADLNRVLDGDVETVKTAWNDAESYARTRASAVFAEYQAAASELPANVGDAGVRDYFSAAGQGLVDIQDISNRYVGSQKEVFIKSAISNFGEFAVEFEGAIEPEDFRQGAIKLISALGESPTSVVYKQALDNSFARFGLGKQQLVPQEPVNLLAPEANPRLSRFVDMVDGAQPVVPETPNAAPDSLVRLPDRIVAGKDNPQPWLSEAVKPVLAEVTERVARALAADAGNPNATDASRYALIKDTVAAVVLAEDAPARYQTAIKTLTDGVLAHPDLGRDYLRGVSQALSDKLIIPKDLSTAIWNGVEQAANFAEGHVTADFVDFATPERYSVRGLGSTKAIQAGLRNFVTEAWRESGLVLPEGNALAFLRNEGAVPIARPPVTRQLETVLEVAEVEVTIATPVAEPIVQPPTVLVQELTRVRALPAIVKAPKQPGLFDQDASLDLAKAVVDYAVSETPRGGNPYETIAKALNADVLPVALRNNLLRVVNKYGITVDSAGNFNQSLLVSAENLQSIFQNNYGKTPDAGALATVGESLEGLAAKIPATLKLRIVLDPTPLPTAGTEPLGADLLKVFVDYTAQKVVVSDGVLNFVSALRSQLAVPDRALLQQITQFAQDHGLTRDLNGQLSHEILITGDMVEKAVADLFVAKSHADIGANVREVIRELVADPRQHLNLDQLGGQIELITLDTNKVYLAQTAQSGAAPRLHDVVVVRTNNQDVYDAALSAGVAEVIAKYAVTKATQYARGGSASLTLQTMTSKVMGSIASFWNGEDLQLTDPDLVKLLQDFMDQNNVRANADGSPQGVRITADVLARAVANEYIAQVVPKQSKYLTSLEQNPRAQVEAELLRKNSTFFDTPAKVNAMVNTASGPKPIVQVSLETALAVNRIGLPLRSLGDVTAEMGLMMGGKLSIPQPDNATSTALQAQASQILVDYLLRNGTLAAADNTLSGRWQAAKQALAEALASQQHAQEVVNTGQARVQTLTEEFEAATTRALTYQEQLNKLNTDIQTQRSEYLQVAADKSLKPSVRAERLQYIQLSIAFATERYEKVNTELIKAREGYTDHTADGDVHVNGANEYVNLLQGARDLQQVSQNTLEITLEDTATKTQALATLQNEYSVQLDSVTKDFFQRLSAITTPVATADGLPHYTVPPELLAQLKDFATANNLVVNGGKLTNPNLEDFSLQLGAPEVVNTLIDRLAQRGLLTPDQLTEIKASTNVLDRLALLNAPDGSAADVPSAATTLTALKKAFPTVVTEETGLPRVSLAKVLSTTTMQAADNPFQAATLAAQKAYAEIVSSPQARFTSELTGEIVKAVNTSHKSIGKTLNAQELFEAVEFALDEVANGRDYYGIKEIIDTVKQRWGVEVDAKGNTTIRMGGERTPLASLVTGEGLTNAILTEVNGIPVEYQAPEQIYRTLVKTNIVVEEPAHVAPSNPVANLVQVQAVAESLVQAVAPAQQLAPPEVVPQPVRPDTPVAVRQPVVEVPIVQAPAELVAGVVQPEILPAIHQPAADEPDAPVALAPAPDAAEPVPAAVRLDAEVPAARSYNQEGTLALLEASTVVNNNQAARDVAVQNVAAGETPRVPPAAEADVPAAAVQRQAARVTLEQRLEVLNNSGLSAGLLGFGIFSAVVGIAAGLAGIIYASMASGLSWQSKAMVYTMNVVRILSSTVILAASSFQIIATVSKIAEVTSNAAKLSTITFGVGNVIGITTNIAQIGIQARTVDTSTDKTTRIIAGLAIFDAIVQLLINVVGLIALAIGPIGVVINLVLLVVSLLIPSTAAIYTAVKYRESWEDLKSKGLYKEAQVMYVIYETSILDATNIVNWTSSIYTPELKSAQERLMDYAWMDASATERMLYSIKNNTDLFNNFQSMRQQIDAAAWAISQPVVNLSNTMTRAVVLMTSQDDLSYFQGDKVASVRLAGVFSYNANTVKRAPKLISATVNGDVLVLTYNQNLASLLSQLPALSTFSVNVGGTSVRVQGVSISGNTLKLSLATAVVAGQMVSLTYSDPTSGNDVKAVQNQNGTDAASVSNYSVVNLTANANGTQPTDTTAPLLSDAVILDDYLSLLFNENLKNAEGFIPSASAFSVTINNSAASVFEVKVSGNRVLLSLLEPVVAGDTVTVSYTAGASNNLQDLAGNLVQSFNGASAVSVDNISATATVDASRVGWLEYNDFVATIAGTGTEAASVLNGSDYTVYDNSAHATNGTARLRYLSLSNALGEYDVYSVVRNVSNNDRMWLDASSALGAVSFSVNTHNMTVWGGQGTNNYSLSREFANSAYIVAANSWGNDSNVVSVASSDTNLNRIVNLDNLLTLDDISAGLPSTQNPFKVLGSSDGLDVVVGTASNQLYYATTNVANVTLSGANASVFVGEASTVQVGLNGRVLVDMDMGRELSLVNFNTGSITRNGPAQASIKGNYGKYSLLNFAPTDSVDSNFIGKLNMVYRLGNVPASTAFNVQVGGAAVAVSSMSISGKQVILNLASAVKQNQAVTVSYTDMTSDNDADTLQDLAGNDVASFGAQSAINLTADFTPPTVKIATVQGSSLVVHFSETLVQQYRPLGSAFTVKVAGVQVLVTKVSYNDTSSVKLTLATTVTSGQAVSVDYADPSASDATLSLQDLAGNSVASFSSNVLNLANIVPSSQLNLVTGGATVNGKLLTLTFDGTPRYTLNDPSVFSVFADNQSVAVSSVSVAGNTVLLNLASAVTSEQIVGVNYIPPQPRNANSNNTLQDWLGNPVLGLTVGLVHNVTGLDVTPPSLSYAIVNGTSLTLTFSEPLKKDVGWTALPNAFAVKVAGTAVLVTQANTSGNSVTLTLAQGANSGDLVSVSYTDFSAANDVAVVQDLVGNDAASFSNVSVVNQTTDVTPPAITSAVIINNQLQLTFNKSLDTSAGHVPLLSSMYVQVAGQQAVITAGSISDKTVLLTLGQYAQPGDYVVFNYIDPSNANDTQALQDLLGNDLSSVSNYSVTNLTGVDVTPPKFMNASVNANTVTLTFSEALSSTAAFTPGNSAFSVSVNGTAVPVVSVTLNGTQAMLLLAQSVNAGQTVTVGYTQPSMKFIRDGAGNPASSFVPVTVTNLTPDTTAPTLSSATIAGAVLTLIFSEDLAKDGNHLPMASQFSVQVDNKVADVVSAVTSGSTVTVTLSKAVTTKQLVTVDYTANSSGTDNNVQDALGNVTASFSKTVTNWSGYPSIQNATVNGSQLVLTFNQELANGLGHTPPLSAFAVQTSAGVVGISALQVSGHKVTLTLSQAVSNGQTLTVMYTDPSTDNDTAVLQNFTGQDVRTFASPYWVNNLTPATVDVMPPAFTSAVVKDSTLTLTFSETLDKGVGEWVVDYLPNGQTDSAGKPLTTAHLVASGFVSVLGSNTNDNIVINDQSSLAPAQQLTYLQLGNGQGVQVTNYDTSGNLLLALGSAGQANVSLESGSILQKLFTTKTVNSSADAANYIANRDTVTLKSYSSLTAYLAGYEVIDATEKTSNLTAEIGEGDHIIKLGGQTVSLQFDQVVSNTTITTNQIPRGWLDYEYFNFKGINADGLWIGVEQDGTVLFKSRWVNSTTSATDNLTVAYDGATSNLTIEVGRVLASEASSQLNVSKLVEVLSSTAFAGSSQASSNAMSVADSSNAGAQAKLYRIIDIVSYSTISSSSVSNSNT